MAKGGKSGGGSPTRGSESRKPTPEDLVLGRHLREARKRADKNQEWLAGELGITYQQLGKYERGESSLKVWMLAKASTLLGVPGSTFLDAITKAGFAEPSSTFQTDGHSPEDEFRQAFERAVAAWPAARRR